MHILWEEAAIPRENPHMHGMNMQSLFFIRSILISWCCSRWLEPLAKDTKANCNNFNTSLYPLGKNQTLWSTHQNCRLIPSITCLGSINVAVFFSVFCCCVIFWCFVNEVATSHSPVSRTPSNSGNGALGSCRLTANIQKKELERERESSD